MAHFVGSSATSALVLACLLSACGGSQPPPQQAEGAAAEPATTEEPAVDPSPAEGSAPRRQSLTAEECEKSGGIVVGDIGDGAVHRPDYRCASGAAPSGDIRAAAGGPMGVEGSVCCPR